MRLGPITHQSLGQDPLKDSSCLNGKDREGCGWREVEGRGPWGPIHRHLICYLHYRVESRASSTPSPPTQIHLFISRGCLNETSGLKNHTVCGSINTSAPTTATQQVPVTLSPKSLLERHVLFIPITPTLTQMHAHLCGLRINIQIITQRRGNFEHGGVFVLIQAKNVLFWVFLNKLMILN